MTEQSIDTSSVEGRAMFGMLAVLAELQRELIVANTRDGLAAARPRPGRRPKAAAEPGPGRARPALYDKREKTVQQIADLFGVPRTTVYNHLKRCEASAASTRAAEESEWNRVADRHITRGFEPVPSSLHQHRSLFKRLR